MHDVFRPVSSARAKQLSARLSFRFVRAAHILGSSMAEIALNTGTGRQADCFLPATSGACATTRLRPAKSFTPVRRRREQPIAGDGSTYGNRAHPHNDPRPEMAALIRTAVQRGGSVVVPSFAVERTQKFLFMLKELMESGEIPRVPVLATVPWRSRRSRFSCSTPKSSRRRPGDDRQVRFAARLAGFHFAPTPEESKKINDSKSPVIIVSSSGMVTGGRILHHLVLRLPDPRNLVLFIGFQAPGTRGFTINRRA